MFETKDGEVVYAEDRKPVVKDAAKLAEVEDTFWTARYYLATHVMGEVYRSIHKTPPFLDAHQTRSMQLYLDYLVKKVEEASGEKVVFEKARLKHEDGTEREIDYYVARLKSAPVAV